MIHFQGKTFHFDRFLHFFAKENQSNYFHPISIIQVSTDRYRTIDHKTLTPTLITILVQKIEQLMLVQIAPLETSITLAVFEL
jgi:hypothetical protein